MVGKGGFMRFEERKYCRIRTLAERWDCSPRRIYGLIERGVLRTWHPERTPTGRGMMIEVQSVLEIERER